MSTCGGATSSMSPVTDRVHRVPGTRSYRCGGSSTRSTPSSVSSMGPWPSTCSATEPQMSSGRSSRRSRRPFPRLPGPRPPPISSPSRAATCSSVRGPPSACGRPRSAPLPTSGTVRVSSRWTVSSASGTTDHHLRPRPRGGPRQPSPGESPSAPTTSCRPASLTTSTRDGGVATRCDRPRVLRKDPWGQVGDRKRRGTQAPNRFVSVASSPSRLSSRREREPGDQRERRQVGEGPEQAAAQHLGERGQ